MKDFEIGEDGTIIKDSAIVHEQTEEEKLFLEYQLLERKVRRISGSTATVAETARYEKLKKMFEKQIERSGNALADMMKKAKSKAGNKNTSKLFAAMAKFRDGKD
ncbi:MAG: hypothetical protein LBJ73_01335 [Rickettsiales bacterium]|jgi:hypothetical protein|nr:hypothetical protein [Rickettsiales bacterium]